MAQSSDDKKSELAPLTVTGVTEVKIGTAIWAIALVLALVFRSQLTEQGFGNAPQICLAGVVLGFLGQIYTRRRVNRLNSVSDIIDS